MWSRLRPYFKGFPAQEKVAQLMVMYGLRVHEGSVYAAGIKISDTSLARAASVDRRVVTATVDTIAKNRTREFLRSIATGLPPSRRGAPHELGRNRDRPDERIEAGHPRGSDLDHCPSGHLGPPGDHGRPRDRRRSARIHRDGGARPGEAPPDDQTGRWSEVGRPALN